MGHVAALVGVLIYVYAILGHNLFGPHDPGHWGTLGLALRSVFQMLTLDDWMALLRAVLPQVPGAWLFFTSFVIVGVFIVVNLFIAVVLNNLETVRAEQQIADPTAPDLLRRVEALRVDLEAFETALRRQQADGAPVIAGMPETGTR
jgi:voltage-gated sodium channel